jgi:hypothetical protein
VSKGKRELFVCGPVPGSDGAAHVKVMRLDRQATAANAAWGDAARGDLLEISPRPTKERPRVDASTVVVRLSADGVPPQDR